MLEGELYRLVSLERVEDSVSATVALRSGSVIYEAHFKGMPITPGVCLIQIVTELVSKAEGRSMNLIGAKDIKFVQPVIPSEVSELNFSLKLATCDQTAQTWQAAITGKDTLRAKMTLTYSER